MEDLDRVLEGLRDRIAESGVRDLLYLEKSFDLVAALELRGLISIAETHESMHPLGDGFAYHMPHEYVSAGAPYGARGPFFLREETLLRLRMAQEALQRKLPGGRLKVFDAFRPRAVQIFMRQLHYERAALSLGSDLGCISQEQSEAAWRVVDRVWARPSNDSGLPTPHSTGAAVDLTIIDIHGNELAMGSSMDESSERILPSYYDHGSDSQAVEYAANRELLRSVMEDAGFCRLSHEWWHFSYGDQFWALIQSLRSGTRVSARYGEFVE